MIFVDSNIVIDLVIQTGVWSDWSRTAVAAAAADELVADAIVLAETAPRFRSSAEQLDYLATVELAVVPIDAEAAFEAGRAHREYRRRGGSRHAIVADFIIGAHALVLGATLLTRDRQRFASYFPDVPLITPETHP